MTLKNTIMSLALGLAGIATAIAGPVDEARKLYRSGDYVAAAELMKPVVKRSPKDGNANFFYGASLFQLGDYVGAEGPLTVAEGRSVAEAAQILAGMSLDRYDVDGAEEHLDKWAAILKKGKKSIPSEHDAMTSRLIRLRNMLDRVERIEILDSLSVDSADFISYYRLSREAGRILPPDAVGRLVSSGFDDELSTAYMPENNTEILWSAADSTGTYRLYGADILDDGTVDHAAPLDDKLGEGGDAKFPFLMPDGVTLYYANNGENSLGGYDIFMTRRTDGDDGKDYFQGQNVGMPYNSPYDDYMLAIDEASGIGWWATDRNRVPGKVTIYVFAPSQIRVNADPDDPKGWTMRNCWPRACRRRRTRRGTVAQHRRVLLSTWATARCTTACRTFPTSEPAVPCSTHSAPRQGCASTLRPRRPCAKNTVVATALLPEPYSSRSVRQRR